MPLKYLQRRALRKSLHVSNSQVSTLQRAQEVKDDDALSEFYKRSNIEVAPNHSQKFQCE
jgi:hypothetical protein